MWYFLNLILSDRSQNNRIFERVGNTGCYVHVIKHGIWLVKTEYQKLLHYINIVYDWLIVQAKHYKMTCCLFSEPRKRAGCLVVRHLCVEQSVLHNIITSDKNRVVISKTATFCNVMFVIIDSSHMCMKIEDGRCSILNKVILQVRGPKAMGEVKRGHLCPLL